MNLNIVLPRLVRHLDHKTCGSVDDKILVRVPSPLEVKVLIWPSMIVPYNYVAFCEVLFLGVQGCDVQGHLVLLGWNDLILYIRVGEWKLPILIIVILKIRSFHILVTLHCDCVRPVFQILVYSAARYFIGFLPIDFLLFTRVVLLLIRWLGCMKALLTHALRGEPIMLVGLRSRQCYIVSIIEIVLWVS